MDLFLLFLTLLLFPQCIVFDGCSMEFRFVVKSSYSLFMYIFNAIKRCHISPKPSWYRKYLTRPCFFIINWEYISSKFKFCLITKLNLKVKYFCNFSHCCLERYADNLTVTSFFCLYFNWRHIYSDIYGLVVSILQFVYVSVRPLCTKIGDIVWL